ncbi:MAG: hypothetical protein ACTHJK_09735 [Sphingomicrobium sp.]
MKHFLNREMLALNVMTFDVDSKVVAEFADRMLMPGGYSTVKPYGWNSDIEWISASDEESFAVFQSAFDRLDIGARLAPYLDLANAPRLYAGFLVVRSQCDEAHFHVDWQHANNEAFTVMTPITSPRDGLGLLYRRVDGSVGEYEYKAGEAIGFGDNFQHSTKPVRSEEPLALLCFEFGTDKMEHWPKIYETVGKQVTHIRQPDGRFVRADGHAVTPTV